MVDAKLRGKSRNWPKLAVKRLVPKYILGPDFPLGGTLLTSNDDLVALYEKGEGAFTVRGEYKHEGKTRLILTSVPYGVRKSRLVERIADRIAQNKIPQLVDIRDESTDEIRIVLETKRGANPDKVLAYLFKRTELEKRIHVRMTCLVPTSDPQVCVPRKVNLQDMLEHFLEFRLEVVTRRLRHELEQLEKRIHILEGFKIIFDALDEAIKIIRSSTNRTDSAQRLRHRFQLSDEQVNAILDARLYKLSQLEIKAVEEELIAKQKRAAEIRALLEDSDARWKMVRSELKEMKGKYGTPRRTTIAPPDTDTYEFTKEDFIPDETVTVIVTRAGRIKRQGSYSDVSKIRVQEGDEVGWTLESSTRSTLIIWTNFGRAYTLRIHNIAFSLGYGDPLQKYFGFVDKERVVSVTSCDNRILPKVVPDADLFPRNGQDGPGYKGFVVACTRSGLTKRFLLDPYMAPSTKKGRMFMQLGSDDNLLSVFLAGGTEHLCLASRSGHGLVLSIRQIPLQKGSGARGVVGIKLSKGDRVLGVALSAQAREGLHVKTSRGRAEIIRPTKYKPSGRGSKGRLIIKRGHLELAKSEPVEIKISD